MTKFRPSKPLFFSSALFLCICFACAGIWAGDSFFQKTLLPTPEWRYLGAPPEKIEQLLAADFSTVYVKTTSGNIYSCYWGSPYDMDCWVRVENVPEILEDLCIDPQDAPPSLPSGQAIDVLQYQFCGQFAGITDYSAFNYYLLDDGTVVQWGENNFGIRMPRGISSKWWKNMTVGWTIGILVSIIAVGAAYFVIYRKEGNEPSQPSNSSESHAS